MAKKARHSLYLRLQMNEGTPLDEVRKWLESLEPREKNRKVEDVLVMCLLAYARLDAEQYTQEELVRTYLECSDTSHKHFSTLRQILNLAPLDAPGTSGAAPPREVNGTPHREEAKQKTESKAKLGKVDVSDIDQMFGD